MATTPHHSCDCTTNTTALALQQAATQNYETKITALTCTFRRSFVVLRCFDAVSPHRRNRHASRRNSAPIIQLHTYTTTLHRSYNNTVRTLQPKTTSTAAQNYETQNTALTCTFHRSFVILHLFSAISPHRRDRHMPRHSTPQLRHDIIVRCITRKELHHIYVS